MSHPVTWQAPPDSIWEVLENSGAVAPEDRWTYAPTLEAFEHEVYQVQDAAGRPTYQDVTIAELRALWPSIEADWRERQRCKVFLAICVTAGLETMGPYKRGHEAAALRVFDALDAAIGRGR